MVLFIKFNFLDAGEVWESPAGGGEAEETDGEGEEKAYNGDGYYKALPCREPITRVCLGALLPT